MKLLERGRITAMMIVVSTIVVVVKILTEGVVF